MGKHTPNTSEYSKPHESKAEPERHVDQHHYDEKGRKDEDLGKAHITDKNAVEMGRQTHELHQAKKEQNK